MDKQGPWRKLEGEQRLSWVQYNQSDPGQREKPPPKLQLAERYRQHGRRYLSCPVPIGEVTGTVLSSVLSRSALSDRITAVLYEHGAAELLEQVCSFDIRGGRLVFQVAEPALLYHLRLRWEQRTLELIRQCLPGIGIGTVRFVSARPQ